MFSYYIIIIHNTLSSSQPVGLHVCVCVSSLDLHILFLAAVGPVGWGLSLSCMTREQINTKHTLGKSLCEHTVWHRNSPDCDGTVRAADCQHARARPMSSGSCNSTYFYLKLDFVLHGIKCSSKNMQKLEGVPKYFVSNTCCLESLAVY